MAFESTSTKSPMAGDYAKLALWYFALCVYRLPSMPSKMKCFLFSRKATVTVSGYAWSWCDTWLKRQKTYKTHMLCYLKWLQKSGHLNPDKSNASPSVVSKSSSCVETNKLALLRSKLRGEKTNKNLPFFERLDSRADLRLEVRFYKRIKPRHKN